MTKNKQEDWTKKLLELLAQAKKEGYEEGKKQAALEVDDNFVKFIRNQEAGYERGYTEAKAEERARILKAIEKWNETGFMSDCLGELNWKELIEIINDRKT